MALPGAAQCERNPAHGALASDRRGGAEFAAALPATVDNRFSSGSACGRYRVAGADLDVRHSAERAILSVFRLRDGGGGISLGVMGDGRHGGCGGGTAVGRSLRGASRI